MDSALTALEANLAETQRKTLELPQEHLWFCALSASYWGIQQRTKGFFEEYHHQFPDYTNIVDTLRKIAIEDRWLYREIPESAKASIIIASLFPPLFSANLAETLRRSLLETFAQFVNLLSV